MQGAFVSQYNGPPKRPRGRIHIEQLFSDLQDEGMSLAEISELIGEAGNDAAHRLEEFVERRSRYFTVDEGCERLEQALAEVKAYPGSIPEYQGPALRPPGTHPIQQILSDLQDEGMSLAEISQLIGEHGVDAAHRLDEFAKGRCRYFTVAEGCERLELALAEIAQRKETALSAARECCASSGVAPSAVVRMPRGVSAFSVPSSDRSSQEPALTSGVSSAAYKRRSVHEHGHSTVAP